ncbi:MAG: HU family DNA-binding protein [Calditrichaeota bacterium]|nr:MAG: HU family DNA-binding protein [Calditrichota bacterium]MBL1204055.1 HU family DNA-binding protein [Calditrichota bacterium]NOG43886.1 HU family DNA-binding protein [Calditrichota bacterium]
MNTSEVIKILSERLAKPQTEIKGVLHSVFEVFKQHLSNHDRFTIPGFGTFDTAARSPRKTYNPHFKKMMLLPKKIVAVFRPSKALKDKTK